MTEQWVDIVGWEGIYQISSLGRLMSLKESPVGRVLSNVNKSGGYLSVVLCHKDRARYTRIHRLVAEAFVPNPHGKRAVNHKDGNKQNNRADNLEWVTPKENTRHAMDLGLANVKGMNHYNRFVRPRPILQITFSGSIVAEYPNAHVASIATGVCHRNIHQVAARSQYKPGMVRSQAGGFIWRFK